MQIDFGQFIHALSDTIDLVGVDEIQHGKRVGFMALECARVMGLKQRQHLDLCRLGLLHDCGVSSTRVHKKLVDELDWTESQHHCRLGAERLCRFAPLRRFAEPIRYHHTRWDQLDRLPLDEEVKFAANLIFLLDRVDALVAMTGRNNRLMVRDQICDTIGRYRDSYFRPDLVEVFLAAAEKEAFWITQQPEHLRSHLQQYCSMPDTLMLNTEQLAAMAMIFAEIVDAKSPYTAEHSLGVTRLAGHLGQRCGLAEDVVARMRVAGLLHDLGKLQVPDRVLEHTGHLEGEHLALMRHHSYVTQTILGRIRGLEQISLWAANHHEKLDGSGYPFRKRGDEIDLVSRIIIVADIFQALAQNRPYRRPMAVAAIVELLERQVADHKLDRHVVAIVRGEPATCHRIAVGQDVAGA